MKKLLIGLCIFLLPALLIFFQFNNIPQNLSFDEVEFAQLALSLKDKPYTVYSPIAFGHSALYFYLILTSFSVFGINNFALRFPSAVFGVLSIALLYVLLKLLLREKNTVKTTLLAITGTLTLVTSHWYLTFSRFSFEATFLLFLELASACLLFIFFQKKNRLYLLFSAIFAGLAFHSYHPGRLFFLLPLFMLAIKNMKKHILPYFLIVAAISSPLLIYLLAHPDYRMGELFVGNLTMVGENVKRTSLMFHISGDMNGRHNFPGKAALNPILGILFLIGIAVGIKKLKLPSHLFMFGYFGISLIPTLFTVPHDNPNMLRTFTTLPAVGYFIVIAVSTILDKFKKYKNIVAAGIIGLLLLSTLYELRTYFVFQSRVFRNAFEVKCPLEKVVSYHFKKIPKHCLVRKNEF